MRAVIQRVSEAQVSVNAALPGQTRGKLAGQTRRDIVGQIRQGLVILLGVTADDTKAEAEYLSEKIVGLRIFSDAAGKFAHSVQDIQGELLVVSQFTLYANTRKGRRPSFTAAAGADKAKPLYEYFVTCCKRHQIPVATGQFQASMAVQLINDGPVTLILDTAERRTKGNG